MCDYKMIFCVYVDVVISCTCEIMEPRRVGGRWGGEGGYELFTAVNLYVGTVEVCVQEGEWGVIEC